MIVTKPYCLRAEVLGKLKDFCAAGGRVIGVDVGECCPRDAGREAAFQAIMRELFGSTHSAIGKGEVFHVERSALGMLVRRIMKLEKKAFDGGWSREIMQRAHSVIGDRSCRT